jgi:hypothetical protein
MSPAKWVSLPEEVSTIVFIFSADSSSKARRHALIEALRPVIMLSFDSFLAGVFTAFSPFMLPHSVDWTLARCATSAPKVRVPSAGLKLYNCSGISRAALSVLSEIDTKTLRVWAVSDCPFGSAGTLALGASFVPAKEQLP